MKDQIKKPRPDLAARIEREVKNRWQPQIRAKAKAKAASTGGIVIDTRARMGYTAPLDQPFQLAPRPLDLRRLGRQTDPGHDLLRLHRPRRVIDHVTMSR